ncbi:MAG: hypothetical protein ACNA8W_10335 [Bradymonadaceae bacterium]
MKTRQSLAVALLATLMTMALSTGCTLIRYVDPPEENNGGGGPGEIVPKVVDVLVMIDLDRSAANLAPHYNGVLASIAMALELSHIHVRSAAMAPLYSRAGGVVPLLYGEFDPRSEFQHWGEAIMFYTYDDGARYLQTDVEADGENLAILGLELDRRAIYRPTTADPEAIPYFQEAADGLIVIYLSASERPCAAGDAACQLNGEHPARYLTRKTEDGNVAWLALADETGLPPNRILHVPIVTAEGVGFSDFSQSCSRETGFPAGLLDVMEPSPKNYYGHFTDEIRRQGGRAMTADLCQAFSNKRENIALSVAQQARQML